jgi:hypothetical protein
MKTPKLLSINADAKTSKGTGKGYLTGICYLSPASIAGLGNLCPHSSEGCRTACLYTAGRAGIFKEINQARLRRTNFLFADRAGFYNQLKKEIASLVRKADRDGLIPVVRLNGTSDLTVESIFPGLFTFFPKVQFYDYTKSPRRARAWAEGKLPRNYHLTFSLSEENEGDATDLLNAGVNVAMVARNWKPGMKWAPFGRILPEVFGNVGPYETFDADLSDLRFLDKPAKSGRGRVGILKAKGKARKDASGFVVNLSHRSIS